MKKFLIAAAILMGSAAQADITIFDVRKQLPMSNTEVVFRDFYINAGSEAGLTLGMVVTVQRRMPLYDSYQNRSAGDLQLKVARVKIIHVQKGLAVARLHSEFTREGTPLLEDNFIMIGDGLDLSSATSDNKAGTEGSSSSGSATAGGGSASPELGQKTASAKIIVNSVELSSQSPVAKPAAAPTASPDPVDGPVLQ